MARDSRCVVTRFLIAFWLTSILCNFSNMNNMKNVGRKRGRRRKITIIFCVRLSRRIIDYWKNWIKPLWWPAYELLGKVCFWAREIRDLRSMFFGGIPARSHVTSALPSGLRFEVHVCTARPPSRGTWFAERFWHLKNSQSDVWEEIVLFRTLLLINYRILYQKGVISAKIELNEWTQTWQPRASTPESPEILADAYG